MAGLQYLVHGLSDQMIDFESQSSDLKFALTNNMKTWETKTAFCVGQISKIEEHILHLENKHSKMVQFQADGEQNNLETR